MDCLGIDYSVTLLKMEERIRLSYCSGCSNGPTTALARMLSKDCSTILKLCWKSSLTPLQPVEDTQRRKTLVLVHLISSGPNSFLVQILILQSCRTRVTVWEILTWWGEPPRERLRRISPMTRQIMTARRDRENLRDEKMREGDVSKQKTAKK